MKYVALLRGINVGGNSIIKMSDLAKVFEKVGLANVRTLINNGNVIFETDEKDIGKITKRLEDKILEEFQWSEEICRFYTKSAYS